MNIFSPTTFTWWQLGLLKWAVLLIGIAVGALWPAVFAPYAAILTVVGLIISIYLGIVWFTTKQ
jgi:hypothetical protein